MEQLMRNIKIIKIEIEGAIKYIQIYDSRLSILETLRNALLKNDFDVILYSCQEIINWYAKKKEAIMSCEFFYYGEEIGESISKMKSIINQLESNAEEYRKAFLSLTRPIVQSNSNLELDLEILFNRFHQIVLQLRDRYNDRDTLDVSDEYDVQDLLHALLKIYCEDIRCEEWTPSYAGSSSRQDFLLKNEQIVIETKKTRKGLNDRTLADELIIDIARYQTHPDCKKLICFVYDPENRINNPRGIEKDLNKDTNEFIVKVFIRS